MLLFFFVLKGGACGRVRMAPIRIPFIKVDGVDYETFPSCPARFTRRAGGEKWTRKYTFHVIYLRRVFISFGSLSFLFFLFGGKFLYFFYW